MEEKEMQEHPLGEELNNFNTDLKEMFMNMEYNEMKTKLGEWPQEDVLRMIRFNHEVVEKYFRDNRLDLIRKFISFVAYASFLVEYGLSQNLFPADEDPMELYQDIFEALRSEAGVEE